MENKYSPQEKYHKANSKCYTFRFIKTTESDLIQKLESVPNKSGYIKRLIREDMTKSK